MRQPQSDCLEAGLGPHGEERWVVPASSFGEHLLHTYASCTRYPAPLLPGPCRPLGECYLHGYTK